MTSILRIDLPEVDRRLLDAQDATLAASLDDTDPFVLRAQLAAGELSRELRRALLSFRRRGHTSGGVLICGVPTGDVPPTPAVAGADDWRQVAVGIRAMAVVLATLGEQCGFRPELGGRLVQDILPVPGFEEEQISLGSTGDLAPHVEMAFSPHRPDYVALLCLRQDHDLVASTTLSSIDDMLPLLDPDTVDVLRTPCFRTKVDASFRLSDDDDGDIWIEGIRVLAGPRDRPHVRVDFAETEGVDGRAHAALARLQQAAVATATTVRLAPGDLLVVDNHRAVHGRTSFRPRYDGLDRWLLRSFVTKDLRPSEHLRMSDSRIVEADYFGAR